MVLFGLYGILKKFPNSLKTKFMLKTVKPSNFHENDTFWCWLFSPCFDIESPRLSQLTMHLTGLQIIDIMIFFLIFFSLWKYLKVSSPRRASTVQHWIEFFRACCQVVNISGNLLFQILLQNRGVKKMRRGVDSSPNFLSSGDDVLPHSLEGKQGIYTKWVGRKAGLRS